MSIETPIDLNSERAQRRDSITPQFSAEELLAAVHITVGRRLQPGSLYSQIQRERLIDVDELGQQAAAERMNADQGETFVQRITTPEENSPTEPYDVEAEYAKIINAKSKRDRNRNIKLAVIGLVAALTVLKACDIPNPIPKPTPRPQPSYVTSGTNSEPLISISLHNK